MAGNLHQPLTTFRMPNYFYSVLLLISILPQALAADGLETNLVWNSDIMLKIPGKATNNLEPRILLSRHQLKWEFAIDLTGPTNFPKNEWIMVTNRVGSKLELWRSDGTKLQLKDADALAALQLPVQTTVSEALAGVNNRWRSGLWLHIPTHTGRNGKKLYVQTGNFELTGVYGAPLTNDVVLKITPLLYKRIDTNQTLRLFEFPPITMKLMTNGDVQNLTDQ